MSVVKLSEATAAQRGSPKPEAPGILAECREILVDRLCASMSGALKRVEADLMGKLESTAMSAEDQRLYGEAQRQLNLIKADLDQRFRAVFQRSFNLKAARNDQPADVYATSAEAPLELALVDQDQVAEEVTVQNLALQMKHRCDNELSELSPRLAYLLGRQEISDEQDPFGPDAICGVLKELCWQIESPKPVKLIILDRLSGSIGEDVMKLYREVNDHLVKRQVLPRLRHSIRRSPAGAPSGEGRSSAAPAGRADDLGTVSEGDLLAGLQQLLAARAGGTGATANVLSAADFLSALTRVQRGEEGLPAGVDTVVVSDGDGLTNVLHALKQSSLGAQVAPFDGLMIDIVATMFDYIFEDPRVPQAMKGLIGRLQIPLLKVAMTDRSFFSSRAHPARRFLNALASSGAEWGDELTPQSALYLKAESLVLRVQSEFEEDVGVISACLAELEGFLADEARRADETAADLTGELEERERREIALTVARAAIEPYLADASLPAAVKGFIDALWVPVLVEANRQGGEEGSPWVGAIAAIDDLVWSVRPKQGAEARKLLVQRLPILLKHLRVGLDSVGTPAEERERFFSQLVGLHAAAVKAGMTANPAGLRVEPGAPAAAPAQAPAPMDSVPVPAALAAQARVAAPERSVLDELARGSWVEFRDGYEEPLRVRLTWVSPARTMYLFTNRQGQRALALTRKELLARFDAGAARVADDTPLIDRVVESVLETIHIEDSEHV